MEVKQSISVIANITDLDGEIRVKGVCDAEVIVDGKGSLEILLHTHDVAWSGVRPEAISASSAAARCRESCRLSSRASRSVGVRGIPAQLARSVSDGA